MTLRVGDDQAEFSGSDGPPHETRGLSGTNCRE
jgi:hypothetical protein